MAQISIPARIPLTGVNSALEFDMMQQQEYYDVAMEGGCITAGGSEGSGMSLVPVGSEHEAREKIGRGAGHQDPHGSALNTLG